jgi:hypothetical protein
LDRFDFLGRLGFTGNWSDVLIGMHGHLFFAEAGHGLHSMSFWKGTPRLTSIRPTSGGQGTTMHVRLTGLNFDPNATTVNIGGAGVSAAVVPGIDGQNTNTKLTARLTIEPGAPTGPRSVTVTTPKGTTTDSSVSFTVTGTPTACPVSLPLTTSISGGTLNVTAGLGSNRFTNGRWAVGWMIFKPKSVVFYGRTLNSGILPAVNPPMTRNLSANVGSTPAVMVVNTFYSPELCGHTLTWASNSTPSPEAVSKSEVETALRSIVAEDFNGTYLEIPR